MLPSLRIRHTKSLFAPGGQCDHSEDIVMLADAEADRVLALRTENRSVILGESSAGADLKRVVSLVGRISRVLHHLHHDN